MNTSIHSPASDLSTLASSGSKNVSDNLRKRLFASPHRTTEESGAQPAADFAALLGKPAEVARGAKGAALPPSSGEQMDGTTNTALGETLMPASVESLIEVKQMTVAAEYLPNAKPADVTPCRQLCETVAALLAPLLASFRALEPAAQSLSVGNQESAVMPNGGPVSGPAALVTLQIGSQAPLQFAIPLPQSFDPANKTLNPADASAHSTKSGSPDGSDSGLHAVPAEFQAELKQLIEKAVLASGLLNTTQSPELLKTAKNALEGQAPHPMVSKRLGESSEFSTKNGSVLSFTLRTGGQIKTDGKEQLSALGDIEVSVDMPSLGQPARPLAGNLTHAASAKVALPDMAQAEEFAGNSSQSGHGKKFQIGTPERTFLNVRGQADKNASPMAGTDVAKSDDTMPATFTSRRISVDRLELPSSVEVRDTLNFIGRSTGFPVSGETTAPVVSPLPATAHRAVETVLNVVEAQSAAAGKHSSSVSLHFKFGGDDLAVRVQLRDGEVHTRFLTDSSELRNALSAEWQTVVGQGRTAGLRLLDPEIAPANSSANSGFGTSAQGQNFSRQSQQQEHSQHQAAMTLAQLRTPNHGGAPVAASPVESGPRIPFARHTSLHLTAIA